MSLVADVGTRIARRDGGDQDFGYPNRHFMAQHMGIRAIGHYADIEQERPMAAPLDQLGDKPCFAALGIQRRDDRDGFAHMCRTIHAQSATWTGKVG